MLARMRELTSRFQPGVILDFRVQKWKIMIFGYRDDDVASFFSNKNLSEYITYVSFVIAPNP